MKVYYILLTFDVIKVRKNGPNDKSIVKLVFAVLC